MEELRLEEGKQNGATALKVSILHTLLKIHYRAVTNKNTDRQTERQICTKIAVNCATDK